ncbi:MAG: sugar nucleotide-binding protein, partial [Parvularculaceae bacterium]|nr:sugar nucleotide-binding protein [Parvularculaceae bacterium]
MRGLVFGKSGQVACELARSALARGWTLTFLSRADVDLFDTNAVSSAIAAFDGDAVLNAAAYTAVDA